MRTFWTAFAIVASIVIISERAGAQVWKPVDLSKALPGQYQPYKINNKGLLIRNTDDTPGITKDFVFDLRTGKHASLALLPGAIDARAIEMSDLHYVLGYNIFPDGRSVATVWSSKSVTPINVPSNAILRDINDGGIIVGEYNDQPFKLISKNKVIFLETTGYPAVINTITNSGFVIGTLLSAQPKAVYWTPKGKLTVIGNCDRVIACNNKLQVLAQVFGLYQILQPGNSPIDIPGLETSRLEYVPMDINDSGYVVGKKVGTTPWPYWETPYTPCVWHPTFPDWKSLPINQENIYSNEILSINDHNVIAGGFTGYDHYHPMLWEPIQGKKPRKGTRSEITE